MKERLRGQLARSRTVMPLFPVQDVVDCRGIARVRGGLGVQVDHDQRAEGDGRRELVDCRAVLVPVRRRVELRPVLPQRNTVPHQSDGGPNRAAQCRLGARTWSVGME